MRVQATMEKRLREAIQHFWTVRQRQATSQGGGEEQARDRGERSAVTAGKHMDGFIRLIRDVLVEAGLTSASIFCKPREETKPPGKRKKAEPCAPGSTRTILPGWFRAEKDWDFVVVTNGMLVAAIEFKSHVGSFGNNCNNRVEEALGNATDLLAAYREGAFKPSMRPWMGYMMLLEDAPKSVRPVRVCEPHFPVFDEFRGASYANRYNILLMKLLRERLYDGTCFLMTAREEGIASGAYDEPNQELGFRNFVTSLLAHATAVAKMQVPQSEASKARQSKIEGGRKAKPRG